MKTYLVGGAVRDKLLGYAYDERDWVVVGSVPDELLSRGFVQVGRNFPVFLHPDTHEEYALARTERKSAHGYHGFVCDFNPKVSLEEDLARRDLTINAMAEDSNGKIIDPFNGQKDLANRVLRHVSPAFGEDPVRVLRVARFAARYYHLGFKIAPDTRNLMYAMVKSGELDFLVVERVWQEFAKALNEKNPEMFIKTLRECGALGVVFPEVNSLFGVPILSSYIDCGIGALKALERAALLTARPSIRLAAFLHNLECGQIPCSNWPISDFAKRDFKIILKFCQRLRMPNDYSRLVLMTARFFNKINSLVNLDPQEIVDILESAGAFRKESEFKDLLVTCAAVCLNNGFNDNINNWLYYKHECAKISVQEIIADGFKKEAIKKELHKRRVACVAANLRDIR